MDHILTRNKFRENVFERDHYKCVFCNDLAVDAHHILERRLWKDFGYYIENGASVCEKHHILCEKTEISVEEVREACGITKKIIPDHFYNDLIYDKWGNIIRENGERTPGELFWDESVQKILKNVLNLFVNKIKYPRTLHLPWSEGISDDDRVHENMNFFENKNVVVTLKMDGENTSLYSDGYFHARSLDGRSHWTQDWVKNFWSERFFNLPSGWRVCGENLFAIHSIKYDNLNSYFYGFSIWTEKNICLSWAETQEWFELLDIPSVPIMYEGIYDEKKIKNAFETYKSSHEGYVLRIADSFEYKDFRKVMGKYVRKNHVAPTAHHWRMSDIQLNGLKDDKNKKNQ